MKKALLLILTLAVLFSCGGKNKENAKETKDSAKTEKKVTAGEIKLNPFYNDIARFIAGMPVSDTGKLVKYTQKKEWKTYAADMDKNWAKFQQEKTASMKPWIEKELAEVNKNTKTVFYPFSGPDFVYVNTFLPDAETYYLVALEPVGIIPDITKIDNSMNSFFGALNNAVRDNLNLSFFITKSMKTQMNNEQIKGTLPVLLFFMARMNYHIQNISPATITKEGKLSVTDNTETEKVDKRFKNGVEISFVKPGENVLRTLYYLSVSIRNDGFAAMPEAETYLKSLPADMTTFVKSSSYCMHEDKYNKIRDIVLSHTKYLIQDDSGIPFRFFDKEKWDYKVHGLYTKPIAAFAHFFQADLQKAIPANNGKLGFRFGYNEESYIFVAKRKS